MQKQEFEERIERTVTLCQSGSFAKIVDTFIYRLFH